MSFWNGKRVLVTGGAGFIGSHLSEALVSAGATVRVFARYTGSGGLSALRYADPALRDEMEIVLGDLRDGSAIDEAVRGCDVVFHLAAHIGIPYSYVHPLDVAQVNMLGTAHVLEAARRREPSRVVLFSTSEVYGTAQYAPIDEAHPLNAQSPYAASKVGADQLGLSYARSFGLPVSLCRPFNTYGPRQPSRAVIPTIISQALKGDEIRLGALTPTRDLVYVRDTARGAMQIAQSEATVGEAVNLATGTEISIGDLAAAILAQFGDGKRIVSDEDRMRPQASEVMRLIGDSSKAARLLGWRAETTLADGLREMIAWTRERAALYAGDSGYRI